MVVSLYAHKLNLFLEYEKNKLYIYSYFASGNACINCKIRLMDKDKNVIKELKTNRDGEYYLDNFSGISYVEVEALGGHAATEALTEISDEKMTKDEVKNEGEFSYLESIIALCLVILIFIGLKKIKK
jgi:nickel transport protein